MRFKLILLAALAMIVAAIFAVPALAQEPESFRPFCSPWTWAWFRTNDGWWYWQWFHDCWDPFHNWFRVWDGWGWW